MDIDNAKAKLVDLIHSIQGRLSEIETEQDARLQLIDRLLMEVLGWSYADIKTEVAGESGYVDYLISHSGRNRFVVEAKRTSTPLLDTKNNAYNSYKLSGPALQSASDGISQAKRYCSDHGLQFAALTTGLQWIGFLANRSDAKSPSDGKALVFPNLDAIQKHFAAFYDLFSKEGVTDKRYIYYINKAEGFSLQVAETLKPAFTDNQVKLLMKSKLALDIEQFFKEFFSSMSGENDPEMLAKCFVESKESREADASLQKIVSNLIEDIAPVVSESGNELEKHIESAVRSKKGEFVLIVGNKGAGKTTYIDRFFRLILDRQLKDRCLVLRIDMADSSGDIKEVTGWMTDKLKDEIEGALFKGGIPDYDDLQGIYYKEYHRWRSAEYKYLYESDKTSFKIKFGEYVLQQSSLDLYKYVTYLLRHSVISRKLMPCIVFDNTDHFPQDFQEAVFQYAQSIHRKVFSFIICPITDRSIWQLSKAGPFQSYETKSFYLPIPSTRDVMEKRVNFIKNKIEEDREKRGDYFLQKGIRINISDIRGFVACLEKIFIQTEYVSKQIGWLSNYDIRRSLQLSKQIMVSPIISIDELVKIYITSGELDIPKRKISQALLLGRYNAFQQNDSNFILNVFSLQSDLVTSPLSKLSILRLLMDKESSSADIEGSYMTLDELEKYFEPTGLSSVAIANFTSELLKFRLIEPYDPSSKDVTAEHRFKVTFSGKMHYEFSTRDPIYIQQMARRTGLRDEAVINNIALVGMQKLDGESWRKIMTMFIDYCITQDKMFLIIPAADIYQGQRKLREELQNQWCQQIKQNALWGPTFD